ncbi:ABC transporter permease [Kineosporia sp. A_224]|uniref:ABC transporter permease n=1 Tax=Kineosporia sp. A_224 TaxID=1962180 RepID=UPI0018E9A378|nr:ABC transporter permease subunit [Kineosporia sp. A_224]
MSARPAGPRVPRTVVLGATGLALTALAAEVLPRALGVPGDVLPPLSVILGALVAELPTPQFRAALAATVVQWGLGLTIAVVLGVSVGVVLGSVPWLRRLTASTVEFLRPIPSVALVPLAVLVLGTQLRSALLLIVYASFWQVLVQTMYGVADVDPVAEQTARSYGLGRWARVRHVLWPTAQPYVATGVRLAAAVALILAITAELVIGSPGLGREIAAAQSGGATALVYGLVLVTGLLGLVVNVGVRALERRLLRWHVSVRGEVAP